MGISARANCLPFTTLLFRSETRRNTEHSFHRCSRWGVFVYVGDNKKISRPCDVLVGKKYSNSKSMTDSIDIGIALLERPVVAETASVEVRGQDEAGSADSWKSSQGNMPT